MRIEDYALLGDTQTAALVGRDGHDDARQTFERLLGLCNDVGLLSEQYDPATRRFLGNFPQAFSHVSLVNTAFNLSHDVGPAEHRKGGESPGAPAGVGRSEA